MLRLPETGSMMPTDVSKLSNILVNVTNLLRSQLQESSSSRGLQVINLGLSLESSRVYELLVTPHLKDHKVEPERS